jgi:hypothetical protein
LTRAILQQRVNCRLSIFESWRDDLVRQIPPPGFAQQRLDIAASFPTIATSFGVESRKSAAESA